MKFVYFTHSLRSCWNHGNAHFLRGVLRELVQRGHHAIAFEPDDAWSAENLLNDQGEAALDAFAYAFPELTTRTYGAEPDLRRMVDGADVVIVHEWNDPALVAALGRLRRGGGRFTLLFHDTHHRAVSDPAAMARFELDGFDGVLAFGEALAETYRRRGWGRRVFVWHEAADMRLFHPPEIEGDRQGVVWIGNWGDGERTMEIEHFLLAPAKAAGLPLDIHGVRYPPEALALLQRYRARYRGWIANMRVPAVFAHHLATVHVPRRYYAATLPGIPTIRVFEALACGIPLISAPWIDSEHLFTPGEDFLVAQSGEAVRRHLETLRDDPALRAALTASGLATIAERHTCAHRVDELLDILAGLEAPQPLRIAS